MYYLCARNNEIFFSNFFNDQKTKMKDIFSKISSAINTLLTFSLSVFFSFSVLIAFAQPGTDAYKNGESLFAGNCASCHYPSAKDMTGPGLKGATERWNNEEKLIAWIKNSNALIEEGYPRAVEIYKEWNEVSMPAQPLLMDEDVKNIIHYIDNYVPPVAKVPVEGPQVDQAVSWLSPQRLFMLIMGLVLLVIVFILGKILRTLRNLALEKQGLPIPAPLTFKQRYLNGPVIALASLAILAFLGFTAYDQAAALGRQQGYAPEQPIEFSHALHAGINGIDCQYCHSGARKGKSAVIPSANVCMNCHKGIEEGPEYGKEEIAKIYEAVDWDPESQTYGMIRNQFLGFEFIIYQTTFILVMLSMSLQGV